MFKFIFFPVLLIVFAEYGKLQCENHEESTMRIVEEDSIEHFDTDPVDEDQIIYEDEYIPVFKHSTEIKMITIPKKTISSTPSPDKVFENRFQIKLAQQDEEIHRNKSEPNIITPTPSNPTTKNKSTTTNENTIQTESIPSSTLANVPINSAEFTTNRFEKSAFQAPAPLENGFNSLIVVIVVSMLVFVTIAFILYIRRSKTVKWTLSSGDGEKAKNRNNELSVKFIPELKEKQQQRIAITIKTDQI